MNPIHAGHEFQIKTLLQAFADKHLILVGSSNAPITVRHLFPYSDRVTFIKMIFRDARIAGIPDYATDPEWITALMDLLSIARIPLENAVFVGGCEEDIALYKEKGFLVHVINRFDGTTTRVSGTEIRDALIMGRPLAELVNPTILPLLKQKFAIRWEEIRRK